MEDPTAAAIGGGASLLGSLASSAFAVHEARQNRRFQRNMANSAHQREVEDLRAAGINPMLSAKLGGNATPPGAVAPPPDLQAPVSSALQAASMKSNLALQMAQTRDLNAAAQVKEIQGRVSARTEIEQVDSVREMLYKLRGEADMTYTQKQKLDAEIKNVEQTLKLLRLDEAHSAYDLERARQESDFYRGFGGKVAPWLNHIFGKIGIHASVGRR